MTHGKVTQFTVQFSDGYVVSLWAQDLEKMEAAAEALETLNSAIAIARRLAELAK